MTIEVHFNLARTETYKAAKFQTPEQKSKYVDAEAFDLKCKDAYFALCAARSPEERVRLAAIVDAVRYNFYLKYSKKTRPNAPLEVA